MKPRIIFTFILILTAGVLASAQTRRRPAPQPRPQGPKYVYLNGADRIAVWKIKGVQQSPDQTTVSIEINCAPNPNRAYDNGDICTFSDFNKDPLLLIDSNNFKRQQKGTVAYPENVYANEKLPTYRELRFGQTILVDVSFAPSDQPIKSVTVLYDRDDKVRNIFQHTVSLKYILPKQKGK